MSDRSDFGPGVDRGAKSAIRPAPCPSCPYRRDCPSGLWAPEEYDKLPLFDRPTGDQPFGAFFCHLDTGQLCAGWVGCHNMDDSLGLRMALGTGRITEADYKAAIFYDSPVPLWGSGAEAAAHGKADIEAPRAKARRTIDKLERRRARREQA